MCEYYIAHVGINCENEEEALKGAKMFEALYNANINLNMICTSEIRVTVLIDAKDAQRAAQAVHDAFGLED